MKRVATRDVFKTAELGSCQGRQIPGARKLERFVNQGSALYAKCSAD